MPFTQIINLNYNWESNDFVSIKSSLWKNWKLVTDNKFLKNDKQKYNICNNYITTYNVYNRLFQLLLQLINPKKNRIVDDPTYENYADNYIYYTPSTESDSLPVNSNDFKKSPLYKL